MSLDNPQLIQHSASSFLSEGMLYEAKSATFSLITEQPKRSIFDFRYWAFEHIYKHKRLPYFTKNKKRLHEALKLNGNLALENITTLNAITHKRHASNLYRRFLRLFGKNLMVVDVGNKKYKKLGKPIANSYEAPDHQEARTKINVITVIHSVEALNVEVALTKAKELKSQLIEYVSMMPGAACIGALEVEVTSIKQMRRLRDYDHTIVPKDSITYDEDGVIASSGSVKEYRKLYDCTVLASHLSHEDINGESGQFIIHFHGVLKVEKHEDIKELKRIFLTNSNWNRANRQILFTSFSRTWGKPKSIECSLKDLSYYFTKGGAVLEGNNSYLKYKIDMPLEMPMLYDEYLKFNEEDNDYKRQKMIDKGNILDIPMLSNYEINALALVIHGMMNWNESGTGYIVSVGNW